jgi:hypothetical protein
MIIKQKITFFVATKLYIPGKGIIPDIRINSDGPESETEFYGFED